MGNLKKTINSGSNRVVRMTISKMHGTAVNKIQLLLQKAFSIISQHEEVLQDFLQSPHLKEYSHSSDDR